MHYRDQLQCRKTGAVPQWQRSVAKSEYNKQLRAAKKGLESQLIKPAKKNTKKPK